MEKFLREANEKVAGFGWIEIDTDIDLSNYRIIGAVKDRCKGKYGEYPDYEYHDLLPEGWNTIYGVSAPEKEWIKDCLEFNILLNDTFNFPSHLGSPEEDFFKYLRNSRECKVSRDIIFLDYKEFEELEDEDDEGNPVLEKIIADRGEIIATSLSLEELQSVYDSYLDSCSENYCSVKPEGWIEYPFPYETTAIV